MSRSLRILFAVCSLGVAGCSATCINGATAIDSIPYTITKPGAYCLAKTLQATAGADGITVRADNVTLDLSGHALLGYSNAGKAIDAQQSNYNVSVVNGTITSWGGAGVFAPSARGSHYERLQVMRNGGGGLLVGPQSIVDRCTVVWNGETEEIEHDGVTSQRASGDGISLGQSSMVMDSLVYGNAVDGIVTRWEGTVTRSRVEANGRAGIWASNGGTVVTDNVIESNFIGVLATRSYNKIDGNHVRFNRTGIAALDFDSVTRNDTISNGTDITGGAHSGFGPKAPAATTSSPWANVLH